MTDYSYKLHVLLNRVMIDCACKMIIKIINRGDLEKCEKNY